MNMNYSVSTESRGISMLSLGHAHTFAPLTEHLMPSGNIEMQIFCRIWHRIYLWPFEH